MSHACLRIATVPDRRHEAAGAAGGASRRAFSLIELMVVVAIMSLLVGLLGAALSGARASSKKQQTQLLISKLDAIIQQQFSTYATKNAPLPPDTDGDGRPDLPAGYTAAAYRSWFIRRNLINGDLPDRWTDVSAMASRLSVDSTTQFPITGPQRAYASLWRGMSSAAQEVVGNTYAGAECLFMIVMQGGVANCIDCGELKTADRGDKDQDGAYEFWDAWGNPIGFILWPAAVELPAGTGRKFFSGERALEEPFPRGRGVYPSPSLGMKPLIYSAGPDGEYGFDRGNEVSNLAAGINCGNWTVIPTQNYAGKVSGIDYRTDNITNLDAEAAK